MRDVDKETKFKFYFNVVVPASNVGMFSVGIFSSNVGMLVCFLYEIQESFYFKPLQESQVYIF